MLKEGEHVRGGSQHLSVGKVIAKSYHCRGLSKEDRREEHCRPRERPVQRP